jgi:hypothetical protein
MTVLVVALFQAVVAGAVQGQVTTGIIAGSVFDSTMAEPLVDAAVFLWDTPYRTSTDSAGRFELTDIPPGEYSLLYFHTSLGEMGVSPGPTSVTVSADAMSTVELATPSVFTVVTSQCLFEAPTRETAILAGFVADGDTGMAMPGAHVSVSWITQEGDQRRLELRADRFGWYRTCAAPANVPIIASAEFLDRQGLRRELTMAEGSQVELGFLLFPMETTHVAGRLVDAESGGQVSEAEVWLRG